MTGIFDGMAGALNSAFGAPVTIHPGGGAAVEIRAVLRRQEIEVQSDEGEPVVTVETILSAQLADVTSLVRGDRVEQGGTIYEVRHRLPATSPAADRFEVFVLNRVAS